MQKSFEDVSSAFNSNLCVSPFAEIEIEIADQDYGWVLVGFQMNKNIFFGTS